MVISRYPIYKHLTKTLLGRIISMYWGKGIPGTGMRARFPRLWKRYLGHVESEESEKMTETLRGNCWQVR